MKDLGEILAACLRQSHLGHPVQHQKLMDVASEFEIISASAGRRR